MKQNRIMFAALAMTALLMTACDKEPQGFDSFILGISGFDGTNGTKATWNANGILMWDAGEDNVFINGHEHTITTKVKNDTTFWITQGPVTSAESDGMFYVAYTGGGSAGYSGGVYTDVYFDGSFVPLAIAGNTNRLTLYPCCAVIMSQNYAHVDFYRVDEETGVETDGTNSGNVYDYGSINVTSATVSGESPAYSFDANIEMKVGDYNCIIIPMGDEVVEAKLLFDFSQPTNGVVRIQKGVVYKID